MWTRKQGPNQQQQVKWSRHSENLCPGITGSRLKKKPVNGCYNATDIQKQGLNEGNRNIIKAKCMGLGD